MARSNSGRLNPPFLAVGSASLLMLRSTACFASPRLASLALDVDRCRPASLHLGCGTMLPLALLLIPAVLFLASLRLYWIVAHRPPPARRARDTPCSVAIFLGSGPSLPLARRRLKLCASQAGSLQHADLLVLGPLFWQAATRTRC